MMLGFNHGPKLFNFCLRLCSVLLLTLMLGWVGQAKSGSEAQGLQVGDVFPDIDVQDQFEQTWSVPAQTQRVYFATNRAAGDWMTELLSGQPAGLLASRQSVYLADLSGMPGFVSTMFALPSLREQSYKVGVVLDDGKLVHWPEDDEAMIVFTLEQGRITAIERIDTQQKLKASLGL